MNRTFALLAITVAGVASCSSTGGGSGVSQQLCALSSACGTSGMGTFTTSFGTLCELLDAESNLNGNLYGNGALFSNELSCAQGASDCASLEACFTVPASASAACKGGTSEVCSGGFAVQCNAPKVDGRTPGYDCSGAGLICGVNGTTAGCGTATCNPLTAKPKCDGDNLVTCSQSGGVSTSENCGVVGETCRVVNGVAMCAGTGAACDVQTFKSHCEGTKIVGCAGDKVATIDCTIEDSAATCQAMNGNATCTGAGKQCTDQTPEKCANGVITYCSWGTKTTLDCKSYGLSGCTTVSAPGKPAAAACTK